MVKKSTKPKNEATPATEDEQVNAAPATEDDQSNITSTPEDAPFAGTHVVNTARGLNLRQRPSFGAEVLDVLPFGTAVQDIDPEGAPAGWLAVTAESGAVGFVAARYVSPIEE